MNEDRILKPDVYRSKLPKVELPWNNAPCMANPQIDSRRLYTQGMSSRWNQIKHKDEYAPAQTST